MQPAIAIASQRPDGGKKDGHPSYPFHKLMSGPTGVASDYELYVSGKVTSHALDHIAAAILQASAWLKESEDAEAP